MAGFEAQQSALADLGGHVIVAASVDDDEKGAEVAADLSFPVAFGVTKDQSDTVGAWWENDRSIVQPTEFMLDGDGAVLASTYSWGALGRMSAEEAVRLITVFESRRKG